MCKYDHFRLGCSSAFPFDSKEEIRKVVRVVEGAALEMLCARKCTVGSNPTSSALFRKNWRYS